MSVSLNPDVGYQESASVSLYSGVDFGLLASRLIFRTRALSSIYHTVRVGHIALELGIEGSSESFFHSSATLGLHFGTDPENNCEPFGGIVATLTRS